jgi:hypothetical protein
MNNIDRIITASSRLVEGPSASDAELEISGRRRRQPICSYLDHELNRH